MKKHFELLDLLRVAAILLVLNSHFDTLYPIPALAAGGAAGNGLFFILSGYCLTVRPGFLHHMARRIARLYPGVLISFGVQLLLGLKSITGLGDFISQLVWPTAFWFVGAIILFDALIWCLNRLRFTEHIGLFSLAMLTLYFSAYVLVVDKTKWRVEEAGLSTPGQCFKLIYCFYMYALGYAVKQKGLPAWATRRRGAVLALAAAMFVGFFAFRLVMDKWPAVMPLQFLTQFMVVGFALGALMITLTCEDIYTAHLPGRIRRMVTAFAAVSLEMYLVQFPVISLCKALPFPVNVLTVIAAVIPLAFLLHAADERIFRRADAALNKRTSKN